MGRPAVRRALWRFDRGAAVDGARRAQPKGACGVGPDRRPGLRQHRNSWAFNNRCAAYNAQKNFSLAITYCDQAIRLDPKGASAFNNRGTAYYDKKDYDRAIADYTEAIRLDPKFALAFKLRGSAYDAKGDYDRAIADSTEAIRLDPNDAFGFRYRGNAYYDKKDYDRAIADYTEAIRLEFKVALSSTTPAPLYRARRRCLPDPRARVLLP